MTYKIVMRKQSTYIQSDEGIMTFDADGRFRQWYDKQRLIKRGLKHDFLIKEILRDNENRTIQRRRLNENDIQAWTQRFEQFVKAALTQDDTEWSIPHFKGNTTDIKNNFIENVNRWSFQELKRRGERFEDIYKPISILPPDQYQAVVLQISEGCSYNKCTFCNFYRDRPFRIKGLEETRDHIRKVKEFFGEDIYRRQTLFLGDANAIIIPQKRLMQLLEIIEDEFCFDSSQEKSMEGIYAFMDVFGLQFKSVEELKELRRHHVKTIYIGLETGDDELRHFIGKQGTTEEVRQQISHVKNAGMHVGVIIMVGVGGTHFREQHREHTLDLINKLPLDKKDMIYLSPFVAHKDLPYVKDMEREGYQTMTNAEIDDEMKIMKERLNDITSAHISNYFIEEFIY